MDVVIEKSQEENVQTFKEKMESFLDSGKPHLWILKLGRWYRNTSSPKIKKLFHVVKVDGLLITKTLTIIIAEYFILNCITCLFTTWVCYTLILFLLF